jgi:hypothetical protein
MSERPVIATLKPEPNPRPGPIVKVDLDDRAFLFPSGKPIVQLAFHAEARVVHVEAVYPFNESRTPPRLMSLALDDARDLGRRLVEAVHTARNQLVVSDSARVAINVVANGYHIQIGDMNQATELFLGTGSIWRVCHGLLRAVDHIAPVEAN